MTLNEIREKIQSGELVLDKLDLGIKRSVRLPVYSKIKGELIEFPKVINGKIEMVKKWYPEILRYEIHYYPMVRYMAFYKGENKGYKVSKKFYDSFFK